MVDLETYRSPQLKGWKREVNRCRSKDGEGNYFFYSQGDVEIVLAYSSVFYGPRKGRISVCLQEPYYRHLTVDNRALDAVDKLEEIIAMFVTHK